MIVFTSPFVLSAAAAGEPLTLPRILYENVLRELGAEAISVSGETDDGPKDMPLEADTGTYWEADALPATWTIDLQTSTSIDAVGIAGHTIGTSGCSVQVDTSEDSAGTSWSALGQEVAPRNNAPLLFLDTARTCRLIRITVLGVGSPPAIASIYAGVALVMPRPPEAGYKPLNYSRRTVLRRTLSRGGQFLGQEIRRMGTSTQADFKLLDSDWYRETFDPFVISAAQYPFFWAWNPSDYPLEVGYVWATRDMAPPQEAVNLVSISIPMEGIGDL